MTNDLKAGRCEQRYCDREHGHEGLHNGNLQPHERWPGIKPGSCANPEHGKSACHDAIAEAREQGFNDGLLACRETHE